MSLPAAECSVVRPSIRGGTSYRKLTLKELALGGPSRCLGTGTDAQFVEDRGEVLCDGAFGNEELLADGLAGQALRHQSQHLPLACAQRARCPGLGHRPLGFLAGPAS